MCRGAILRLGWRNDSVPLDKLLAKKQQLWEAVLFSIRKWHKSYDASNVQWSPHPYWPIPDPTWNHQKKEENILSVLYIRQRHLEGHCTEEAPARFQCNPMAEVTQQGEFGESMVRGNTEKENTFLKWTERLREGSGVPETKRQARLPGDQSKLCESGVTAEWWSWIIMQPSRHSEKQQCSSHQQLERAVPIPWPHFQSYYAETQTQAAPSWIWGSANILPPVTLWISI